MTYSKNKYCIFIIISDHRVLKNIRRYSSVNPTDYRWLKFSIKNYIIGNYYKSFYYTNLHFLTLKKYGIYTISIFDFIKKYPKLNMFNFCYLILPKNILEYNNHLNLENLIGADKISKKLIYKYVQRYQKLCDNFFNTTSRYRF